MTISLQPHELAGLRRVAMASFSRPSDLARRVVLAALRDMAEDSERPAPRPPPSIPRRA